LTYRNIQSYLYKLYVLPEKKSKSQWTELLKKVRKRGES
jgi:hypothetical protein